MEDSSIELKVLTFNLWGIFNSKMKEERMKHFASKIGNYDIILLQEQFSPEDFEMIQEYAPDSVRQTRYFRRFPSSFYGSGCAVISRFPIRMAFFHTYPLQGYPEMVLHGDFFANKGVAMVKIDVPVTSADGSTIRTKEVTLYTTHLVAVYQKVSQLPSWKNERYLPFRTSQAISLANFIMSTSRPSDTIIIGGDFNCAQTSLEVQLMLVLLRRHGYNLGSVLPPPRALLRAGNTTEEKAQGMQVLTYSDGNTFNSMKTSYFKLLKMQADIPSQIDHIFYTKHTLALSTFPECPDAPEDGYPFTLGAEQTPNGVVVFTKNEVYVPPKATFWSTAATAARSSDASSSAETFQPRKPKRPSLIVSFVKSAVNIAKQLWYGDVSTAHHLDEDRPVDGNSPQRDREVQRLAQPTHMYPISDHYGVAAKMVLHLRNTSEDMFGVVSSVSRTSHVPLELTADEARVVQTAIDFLDDFTLRMRSQVSTSRLWAGTSLLLIAGNCFILRRLLQNQESRMSTSMGMLYEAGAAVQASLPPSAAAGSRAPSSPNNGDVSGWLSSIPGLDSIGKATNWTLEKVHLKSPPPPSSSVSPQASSPSSASNLPALMDYGTLTRELCLRPMWAAVGVQSAANAVLGVSAVLSFTVGMFQRAGNASILADQVEQLRML